jgi:hypothetical protein
MPDELHKPKARICPHCCKEIPKLPTKPRDLGLLLHWLIYSVPCENPLTEELIETARNHCRMMPERLAVLRAEPHARHWPRMQERRAARLAYFRQHGKLPPPGLPLLPGEPYRLKQIDGFYRYRKGGLAKLKARVRKRQESANVKLANLYMKTKRLKSPARKSAALDDVLVRLVTHTQAATGKLTLADYEELKPAMRPDKSWLKRLRQQRKQTHLSQETLS